MADAFDTQIGSVYNVSKKIAEQDIYIKEHAIQGPQGPKGETGSIGPQGPAGPQGPQGIQGEQGPKGDTGENGTSLNIHAEIITDPANLPAFSTAQINDAYVVQTSTSYDLYFKATDGTTWTIITNWGGIQGPQGETGATGPQGPQGVQGPQGEQGPQGDTGPQGPKGATGDTGNGISAVTLTSENGLDFTMTDGTHLYTASVKGPKGDTGETGATGPQGPKGDTGEQGPQGIQGPQGPQGPAGANGTNAPNFNFATATFNVEFVDGVNCTGITAGRRSKGVWTGSIRGITKGTTMLNCQIRATTTNTLVVSGTKNLYGSINFGAQCYINNYRVCANYSILTETGTNFRLKNTTTNEYIEPTTIEKNSQPMGHNIQAYFTNVPAGTYVVELLIGYTWAFSSETGTPQSSSGSYSIGSGCIVLQ